MVSSAQIGQFRFRVGSTDIPNCAAELSARSAPSMGATAKSCPAVMRAFRGLPSSTISGIDENTDDKQPSKRSPGFRQIPVYPIGFDFNGSVPLLKKDNIRNDIRTGVGAERIVGQADRAEEVRALGDRCCGAVLGVHGARR